mmetsp:Transcript_11116/g.19946  ORF Transcript_11116/g.19946 Transcript_11116/m.19946 type:complete len:679 (-) Transcript_11116:283-2319(-)
MAQLPPRDVAQVRGLIPLHFRLVLRGHDLHVAVLVQLTKLVCCGPHDVVLEVHLRRHEDLELLAHDPLRLGLQSQQCFEAVDDVEEPGDLHVVHLLVDAARHQPSEEFAVVHEVVRTHLVPACGARFLHEGDLRLAGVLPEVEGHPQQLLRLAADVLQRGEELGGPPRRRGLVEGPGQAAVLARALAHLLHEVVDEAVPAEPLQQGEQLAGVGAPVLVHAAEVRLPEVGHDRHPLRLEEGDDRRLDLRVQERDLGAPVLGHHPLDVFRVVEAEQLLAGQPDGEPHLRDGVLSEPGGHQGRDSLDLLVELFDLLSLLLHTRDDVRWHALLEERRHALRQVGLDVVGLHHPNLLADHAPHLGLRLLQRQLHPPDVDVRGHRVHLVVLEDVLDQALRGGHRLHIRGLGGGQGVQDVLDGSLAQVVPQRPGQLPTVLELLEAVPVDAVVYEVVLPGLIPELAEAFEAEPPVNALRAGVLIGVDVLEEDVVRVRVHALQLVEHEVDEGLPHLGLPVAGPLQGLAPVGSPEPHLHLDPRVEGVHLPPAGLLGLRLPLPLVEEDVVQGGRVELPLVLPWQRLVLPLRGRRLVLQPLLLRGKPQLGQRHARFVEGIEDGVGPGPEEVMLAEVLPLVPVHVTQLLEVPIEEVVHGADDGLLVVGDEHGDGAHHKKGRGVVGLVIGYH